MSYHLQITLLALHMYNDIHFVFNECIYLCKFYTIKITLLQDIS